MKKSLLQLLSAFSIILSLVLSGALAGKAHAATGGPFGLGLVFGDPTGLSMQYSLRSNQKLDFTVAWALNSRFVLAGDMIFMFPHFVSEVIKQPSPISAYVGIGGILTFSDEKHDTQLGLRIPLGLDWRLATAPVGFFFELVPGLALIPDTDGEFQGGIGARYFF